MVGCCLNEVGSDIGVNENNILWVFGFWFFWVFLFFKLKMKIRVVFLRWGERGVRVF